MKSQSLAVIILLLAACIFAAGLTGWWNYVIDDSFITFRYSKNFVHGMGLKFNAIDGPAEGYSTFLYAMIIAIPEALGIDALQFSKFVGVGAAIGYAAMALAICVRLGRSLTVPIRLVSASLAILLLATFAPATIHAISGMETSLYTLELTTFFYLLICFVEEPKRKLAFSLALLSLLLGLTRPEGNVAAVAGLAGALFMSAPPQRRSLIGFVIVFYILPAAVYFVWRYSYYHLFFPLPFYLKMPGAKLLNGWQPVLGDAVFLTQHIGVPVIIAVTLLRKSSIPALLAGAAVTLFFIFPIHMMDVERRYTFPVYPFLFALAGLGIGQLMAWIEQSAMPHRSKLLTQVLVASGITFASGSCLLFEGRSTNAIARRGADEMRDVYIALGKYLGTYSPSAAPADQPVVALEDAGALPYYSNWNTVDFYTLNDVYLARLRSFDPGYVFSRKPSLIVLRSKSATTFIPRNDKCEAMHAACMNAKMECCRVIYVADEYYDWLYVWPNTEIAGFVTKWKPASRVDEGTGAAK